MSVSGTMALSQATMKGGQAGITAQRGTDTWGANYLFDADGLQNDVLVISDVFNNLSTSGAYATDAELLAVSGALRAVLDASGANLASASGAIMTSASGMAIYLDDLLSGTLVTAIATASGAITASGEYFNQPTIASGVMYGRIGVTPSGSVTIGTKASPMASGFAVVACASGGVFQLYVTNEGIVSGYFI